MYIPRSNVYVNYRDGMHTEHWVFRRVLNLKRLKFCLRKYIIQVCRTSLIMYLKVIYNILCAGIRQGVAYNKPLLYAIENQPCFSNYNWWVLHDLWYLYDLRVRLIILCNR